MHFDPLTHTYTDGGVIVPSVTTIIEIELGLDTSWFTPGSAQKGTDVHEATALVDTGEMHPNDFDEWMIPYLDGWALFQIDTGFKATVVETMVGGASLGYAGRVDRIGTMQGGRWVIDIKTGRPAKWHPLQTAAYALAVDSDSLDAEDLKRGCVHLDGKGGYRLREHADVSDYGAWNIMMAWRGDRSRYK